MQLYKENGYIEPERLPQGTSTEEPQPQQEQQVEEIATPQQEQQPETAQLPELGGIGKFFEENIAIPLIDQLDGSRDADQVASDRADARQGRADLDQQIQDNPTVLGETGTAVIGGVGDTIETVVNTADLAGDVVAGGLDAVGVIDRDSSDIPWDESYEWADFDLGTAENQTIVGNVGRSIVSTLVGMKGLRAAGVGVGTGKSVASRLASEALRGGLYDFFSPAGGDNISNLVQLGPLANPFSKALAHNDEDNVWIRRIKNTIEGGTIGLAVDGLQELYVALRAGKAAVKGGASAEKATQKTLDTLNSKQSGELTPGKIENDAASGRPGTPEEGGKSALLDPQERVFQGLKEQDTNTAAKSFWDDAEPGGGNSIVDELDVKDLQGVQQLKDFVSTRIPDINVEDIARRLRRQPAEYVEDVFRSLATFSDTKNFADLETLRFVNTFDIKGVDAGGAVVLDTLNKSLADRVSILAGQVADLTELDAPFRVQANQILDRANSMVLLRKEATQFASQNLQNWKDVPNDLKSAVEADRSQINAIFDELRQGLASDDALDIKLAKERFSKLGIALASSKGDPTAQMGVWEALAKVGWNQFEGVYINSMLSSPLTHARNIAGNAIAVGERTASRTLGNLFTGNITEAKRGLAAYDSFGASLRESFAVARESLSSPYSRVTSTAKISDRTAASRRELLAVVNGAQSQSEKIAAQTALRAFDVFNSSWFRWPGKALQAGDDFFKSFLARTELRYQAAVEADELAKTASLNPTKAKALRDSTYSRLVSQKLSPTGEILDHKLISISEEATFQRDLEGWAAGMSTGLRSFPGGRIMVPFLKTGHNINRYAKELTPLQMLSKEYGQVMKHGTPDEKAIMNGRIALGSTVMGTTAFLAGEDLITGVGPLPGPQRDLWLKDHEPMSVKVWGKWVSYQAIPGFSLLVSTTTDITQMAQKMSDGNIDYVLGAAPFFFTNAISTQPMFQGVLDMAEVLDFANNYSPEKVQDTINSIANRMAGNEGLRRHMENAISQNMYDYKNWAWATIGKLTGGILPSAYDTLLGEDVAKVPRLNVLTGNKMVSKYSNPLNSLQPFTVVGKDVSPLVEVFASLDFPINLVVPDKVAGVKLTPDQKNFLTKEIYRDGEMARKFAATFKSDTFWARVDKWQEDKKLGTALPKEQTDWYRILARTQQKYKSRAIKELRNGSSEYSEQFRNEYAAKNMEENSNGLSKEDMNRLRDIQELAGF